MRAEPVTRREVADGEAVHSARRLVRMAIGLDRPERDVDFPCPNRAFEPGEPSGDCDTDGHYMCGECVHCRPGALEERY